VREALAERLGEGVQGGKPPCRAAAALNFFAPETLHEWQALSFSDRCLKHYSTCITRDDRVRIKPQETPRITFSKIHRNVTTGIDVGKLYSLSLSMSQGQMRKILLARGLAAAPRCMILDEFCNGLDIPSRKELLRLIDVVAKIGVQVIYTTHRQDEIISSITHALFIKDGHITAQGVAKNLLAHSGLHTVATKEMPTTGKTGNSSDPSSDYANDSLISIQNASVYLGNAAILHSIDWEMQRDQNWAILGQNGAGKSTLLKLIFGEIHPVYGSRVCRCGDENLLDIWEIKKRIGYISSEFQANYDSTVTGREIILSGFFGSIGLYEQPTDEQQEKAQRLIEQFKLGDLRERRLSTMSYGQSRKFLIARALVHNPELLILDEACNGLDIPSRKELLALIENLVRTTPMRIIMVTHHMEELIPCISHVLLLKNGSIANSGLRDHVLHPERLHAIFEEKQHQAHDELYARLRKMLKR
jgi:molybdate transport system ATP-binding protein